MRHRIEVRAKTKRLITFLVKLGAIHPKHRVNHLFILRGPGGWFGEDNAT